MNTGKPATRKATARYGLYTIEKQHPTQHVTCPVPGCGRTVALTNNGCFEYHTNAYGFCCDGVNMPPAKAAGLQIDSAGRLVGVDEMAIDNSVTSVV